MTLALLGAWHGANPGMGWLFALSRGLQERRGSAVAGALPPIALGHALAVGLALMALAVGNFVLPTSYVCPITAVLLIGVGVLKLIRHRHPRWVGMNVGFGGLLLWSFLMANAHGAGLMLVPLFVISQPGQAPLPACHQASLALSTPAHYLGATLLHTAAMLLVTGAIALVVYYKLGLSLLRRAWFNLDWVWSAALVVSGIAALVA